MSHTMNRETRRVATLRGVEPLDVERPAFEVMLENDRRHGVASGDYSGTAAPEPPSSVGKSLSFGSPSFIRSTVSA